MSKYNALWDWISENDADSLKLTFDEIGQITGQPLDHSFLAYKKELMGYGYVMKQADWLIDVGPDGGTAGGEIVLTGTPKEMAERGNTITAEYLRKSL